MAAFLRLSFVVALAAALLACRLDSAPAPRRLVLITLDTLRLDTLMGTSERPSAMPRTKAWADAHLRFNRCFSAASATQPTHAALFTGLPPWLTGVTRNGLVLDAAHDTLAERLHAAHWSTSAVVSAIPVTSRFGFAQGFDRYTETFDLGARESWAGHALGPNSHFYTLSRNAVESALAALDAADGDKQFFWFHFFDVHAPYGDAAGQKPVLEGMIEQEAQRNRRRPTALLGRAHDLYDADARVLDRQLARLLARLEERSHATTIVLTADHGESFGEDGSFGHGRDVSEVLNHVPCILSGVGVAPGIRTDVAGSTDLFATLLASAGITPPVGPGRDLLATSTSTGVVGMRPTVAEQRDVMRADGSMEHVDYDRFFLVQPDGTFLRSRGLELDPPVEIDPVARTAALARFRAAAEALAARGSSKAGDLSAETKAQLRALGYVE